MYGNPSYSARQTFAQGWELNKYMGSSVWTQVRETVLSLYSHGTTFTPLLRALPFQLKQKQHQAAKDIC